MNVRMLHLVKYVSKIGKGINIKIIIVIAWEKRYKEGKKEGRVEINSGSGINDTLINGTLLVKIKNI